MFDDLKGIFACYAWDVNDYPGPCPIEPSGQDWTESGSAF